ncbi:beta strand repeat-containing protein [Limimaricola sp. AA108-03]|uniref:beta strand repeat-containing protein n=1 Tax=Limimaricola sp. AA108-03 TaxID=3425945 RepID=UPI003D77A3D4
MIGGAGIDTIDYSYLNGSDSGVFIDLANRFAAVGGGDVDIVGGFENVIDSTGNDVLLGDSAGNIFRLLGGHDIVNGRGGTDVVQLEGKAEDWKFTLLEDAEGKQIGVEATKGTHTVKAYDVEFFQFKDGSSGGDSMFRVKVEPTDEAEGIARDDSADVQQDREVELNLVSNDDFLGALMPKIIAASFGGTPVDGSSQTFTVEGKYGTLVIDAEKGTAKYTANKADSLAEGIEGIDIFTYGINGDDAQITITITGTNDAPVIDAAASTVSGGVTERADKATDENTALHTAKGAVVFTDVDLTDTHTAGVVAQGTEYLGEFSLDTSAISSGSVGWSFAVADGALDSLAQGQKLIQSYDITVDDENDGGTAVQTVTITITGTNDAPVIDAAASTVSGGVTERADKATDENTALHTAKGAVVFTDVDLTDTHTAGVVAQGTEYLGEFSLDTSAISSGSVGWSFAVADGVLDSLAQGQKLIQSYDITVDDENDGGTAVQTVTITITGTNDAPVIDAAASTVSGGVTERADKATDENTALHTAKGAVVFTDVDLTDTHTAGVVAQGTEYLGEFSLDTSAISSGSVGWSFAVADGVLDSLAQGQKLIQSYDITVDDENDGGTAVQTVTITITGTNDAPVIDAAASTVSGGVTERADKATDENTALHTAKGAVVFTDVDLTDTHTAGVVAQGTEYLGEFSLDTSAISSGSVGWSFAVADGVLDSLAQGQKLIQSYDITVDDENDGGTAVQTVTITITGTNDAPVIDAAASTVSGGVTERADKATDENTALHTAKGAVVFTDVDLTDTHTAGVVAQGTEYLGEFSLDTSAISSGSVGWSFAVADGALDSLAQGQKLIQSYDITVDDENDGGTAVQTVTITITGTNDAPVIDAAASTVSGGVTERADKATDENTALHTAKGAVVFTDVDLTDTHTAGVVAQGTEYLGEFSLDTSAISSGSVGWSFAVADGVLDSLAQGQKLIQSYDITVDDENDGGTAVQTVTITITGTNDAPVIDAAASTVSGGVTERADKATDENTALHTAKGAVVFTDVDLTDTHTAGVVAQGTEYLGEFSLDTSAISSGSVGWSFAVADGVLDSLAQGQKLIQSYDITVDDENDGGTAVQTVTITITGTNDAPVIDAAASTVSGGVTERADKATDENTALHTAKGAVVFTDVDLTDTHTPRASWPRGRSISASSASTPAPSAAARSAGASRWPTACSTASRRARS